jgi:hypothetical protein
MWHIDYMPFGRARPPLRMDAMLRVCFCHRELLGELSRAEYETVKELMTAACLEDESFCPGTT